MSTYIRRVYLASRRLTSLLLPLPPPPRCSPLSSATSFINFPEARLQIHARYIRLPRVARHPREVRSYVRVCPTGEITINCTRTLLEIQDKHRSRPGRAGEEKKEEGRKRFLFAILCSLLCHVASPRPKGATFHNGLVFLTFPAIY